MHYAVLHQIINTEFHVLDAVFAWRDSIYKADNWKSTKGSYLLNMLKLIESGVIEIRIPLSKIDESWLKNSKQKIDDIPSSKWSVATKSVRKSCLNSFYKFIKTDFDYGLIPYQRYPSPEEIKHILSSCQEKALTINICPIKLCTTLSKINERDAYIVWLMIFTGKKLEAILNLRKENFRTQNIDIENDEYFHENSISSYLDFEGESKFIPAVNTSDIKKLCKNSTVYLFETACGKRITRTQITRNLKQAGRKIGLNYDLTPKLLHGCVIAYMSKEKRSEVQITCGITIVSK